MINRIFQNTNKLFKTGAVLVVFFSLVIGFLNIGVLYLFGIPLILLFLGIIFVWFAEATFKKKLLLTFLPLFLIPWTFIVAYHMRKAEPETFLIPKNLRGEVVIFYEESCGEKPTYENGRRIYKFPENGILITNFKRPKGYLDQNFYFVDETGNRTPITKRDVRDFNFRGRTSNVEDEPSRDEIAAFYSTAFNYETNGNNSRTFVISTFKYFEKDEKERWQEIDQFSERADALLKNCRQN